MEVESLAEMKFLLTISNRFWLGTARDPDSGMWRWIETGKEVNFAVLGPSGNYGDEDDVNAFAQGGVFVPVDTRYRRDMSVICETPTIHAADTPAPLDDPTPTPTWTTLVSEVNNSTYLFSDAELPWMAAQEACREKGAILAEIETPEENDEILAKIFAGRRDRFSRWLGAYESQVEDGDAESSAVSSSSSSSPSTSWRWAASNRSLAAGFTDWQPDQHRRRVSTNANASLSDADCLLLATSSRDGFFWRRHPCVIWRKFVCEIRDDDDAGADEDGASAVVERYVGVKECQENTYHFDGFATTVKNCFHVVRLQRSFHEAQQFCQDQFGETLAEINAKQATAFQSLLQEYSANRTRVRN